MFKKKPWRISINIKIINRNEVWCFWGRSAVIFFTGTLVISEFHPNPNINFAASSVVPLLLRCIPSLFKWDWTTLSCRITEFSSTTFNLSTYLFRMIFAMVLIYIFIWKMNVASFKIFYICQFFIHCIFIFVRRVAHTEI